MISVLVMRALTTHAEVSCVLLWDVATARSNPSSGGECEPP